ncbi:MAG TPA: ABC transporter substrate-binding protein [Burkholderiales bacterium]|nr:ABC transporter substrate-binding protein [Burkholderiales bacterium]
MFRVHSFAMSHLLRALACVVALLLVGGCSVPWNDPYPASERRANILYTSFTERPKHLDPVQSYSENEYVLIANIYMPPLQYHYLKRPYQLVPFAASEMPKARFYDAQDRLLPDDASADRIAYTVYEVRLRPGLRYQPHPAFALDESGHPLYETVTPARLRGIYSPSDFKQTATREVTADDYVYQIKRLAHPRLHSPIYGLMSEKIVGLKEYGDALQALAKRTPQTQWLDLNSREVSGVSVVDAHTYRIRVKGKYPQFLYWLAMPFFAPIPFEVDRFYSQPGMAERNLSLDWFPVGSGPYMMTVNNPNRQMVLARNPNFAGEPYPNEGEPQDAAAGLLGDAGRPMPFIDGVVFSLEKESIPYWNKFLQGYYDASAIASDNFDQVIQVSGTGEAQLTPEMRAQGIQLQTSVATSIMYIGFNMLDPVVGGDSERARKLRQAISIAIDHEDFISIFLNGRGIAAQGPIPPGIFGYREGEAGINHYMYEWVNGAPKRKSVAEAKRLLAEAGYPNGIDAQTGKPLTIYFDSTLTGVGAKARTDWLIKQFQSIDLQLVMRTSDYNRFQEKMRKGTAQLYYWGWNADYPDPENFLFLFYGPQGKTKFSGENASNYSNPEFDRMFERMREMDNGPERQALIDKMLELIRRDAPWAGGFHPKDFALAHQWVYNRKPNKMANNGLKYQRIDPLLREQLRAQWNRPVLWPFALAVLVLGAVLWPAYRSYRRREQAAALPGAIG